jgi:rhodanese-related sulfurtransferase
VRTLEEYKKVHLENALLLPVEELSQETLNQIGLGGDAKDKEIIIYCRSGGRSKIAYNIMDSLGYTNIKSSAGGMIHWEEDNYPFTETGEYTGPRMMDNSIDEESGEGPRMLFDRIFHDFGVIPQYGGTVQETFTVKNIGTETLTIGDISTSCSCTSATISSTSIEPGEGAELTVVFDPDFHEEPLGVFKRTVFIPTNDPQNQEAEVEISVDILENK